MMDVRSLSQGQADTLMKSLEGTCLSHFLEGFHAESHHEWQNCWALPADKRLYYRVESYLFGVDCEHDTTLCLSSFARVDATHPHGTCAMCLKCLIDEILAPLCRTQHKTRITAVLTACGTRVFHELQSIYPGVHLGTGDYSIALIDLPQPA